MKYTGLFLILAVIAIVLGLAYTMQQKPSAAALTNVPPAAPALTNAPPTAPAMTAPPVPSAPAVAPKNDASNTTQRPKPPVLNNTNITQTSVAPPSKEIYTAAYWKNHMFRGATVEMGYLDNSDSYPSADSFRQLKSLGANIVNLEVQYLWTIDKPYKPDELEFRLLTQALDNIRAANLSAVVAVRGGPGRNDMLAGLDEANFSYAFYGDSEAQDAYISMLEDAVARIGNRSEVIAFEPLVEPTPQEYFDDYENFSKSAAMWNGFAQRAITAVRAAGFNKAIVIEPILWGEPDEMPLLKKFDDSNIVYSIHTYQPFDYTHQYGPYNYTYPGEIKGEYYDEAKLAEILSPAVEFKKKYDVPIFVGEYGGVRFVPNIGHYISDMVSLFEKNNFSHAYYDWGKDPGWDVDAFNLQYGTDRYNHQLASTSLAFGPILSSWKKNNVAPVAGNVKKNKTALNDVRLFAYVLQDAQDYIKNMTKSRYDLLVIDNIRSVKGMEDYNTVTAVSRLKNSTNSRGGKKLVMAYISIGEAESYRSYWQDGWRVGSPDWVLSEDPDGWTGNYIVKFWDPRWRHIVYDYLDQIIADGFDGVYLDWVGAYDIDQVDNAASDANRDAKKDMISFVCEISKYVKKHNMTVVAMNAADLGLSADYLSCIDGEAQESIWYGGYGEPMPDSPNEGDTPTDAQLTRAYLISLKRFQDANLPVFSIDYAQRRPNADEAYSNAQEHGFIEYVTTRSLNKLTETIPPWY